MTTAMLLQPEALSPEGGAVVIDCRYSLASAGEGRTDYMAGHIPGAHYLDLAEDLSGPVCRHGGRHPLPEPDRFAATLARLGVGPDSNVVAYDDSRLAFCSRLWWMMRSIGFKPPRLLDGGYRAWLDLGFEPDTAVPDSEGCEVTSGHAYAGVCDIAGLRLAQGRGALVIDSREARRYEGLEEPIDPVAGHIPGAVNRPWQGVTRPTGEIGTLVHQHAHMGDVMEAGELVVYCGSGVTACVNVFSLALLGREDATLYGGSWSDWCSYLEPV